MMSEISSARTLFPSGLFQPEGSFRFSADALHLARFALTALNGKESVADLGAGCGIVGLALLLRRETLRVVGVEREQALADAARLNADRLGLKNCHVLCGDVAHRETLLAARRMLKPESCHGGPPLFDAAVCNPPWRTPGSGRSSPSPLRRGALEAEQGIRPFLAAADGLLGARGSLFLALSPDKLADALRELPTRLRPVRLRFVHPCRKGVPAPAALALLEARKNSRAPLVVEEPLVEPPQCFNPRAPHPPTD